MPSCPSSLTSHDGHRQRDLYGRRVLRRYCLMAAGWTTVVVGVVSYPVPLFPSTVVVMIGLLMLAESQRWARAIVVVSRRRLPPVNRAYLAAERRFRRRR